MCVHVCVCVRTGGQSERGPRSCPCGLPTLQQQQQQQQALHSNGVGSCAVGHAQHRPPAPCTLTPSASAPRQTTPCCFGTALRHALLFWHCPASRHGRHVTALRHVTCPASRHGRALPCCFGTALRHATSFWFAAAPRQDHTLFGCCRPASRHASWVRSVRPAGVQRRIVRVWGRVPAGERA